MAERPDPVAPAEDLATTPLHALHRELGARMVPFAGWEMPIQYEGVLAEHLHCRAQAALFDVSHMTIVDVTAPSLDPASRIERLGTALETLTPAGIVTLAEGRQRYALLTNEAGGTIDDFIATNRGDYFTLVVNASRRDVDLPHLRAGLGAVEPAAELVERPDLALIALQGPLAVEVLASRAPDVAGLQFLDFAEISFALDSTGSGVAVSSVPVAVSRSGYTGEDGFEIMVDAEHGEAVARALLAAEGVAPAGLGARDSLRLEAGLPLYGQDLDEHTSLVEAGLNWTMPKRRREAPTFPGHERILDEYTNGPTRRRVGLRPLGKRPVRHPASLRTPSGEPCGIVTSGGFGPSVDGPVAQGYVSADVVEPGTRLVADVRGKDADVEVVDLPFVPHRYHRGA